jgi:rhodanese-related sulfurtransferase
MFFNSTPSASTIETAKHVGESGVAFIDVRTPAEYKSGHAKGAENYPLQQFSPALVEKLKQYETVYVICQSGGRSSTATSHLRSAKINAINVSGGTSAWQANHLPMQ